MSHHEEDLSYVEKYRYFPLIETVHKYYGGTNHKERFESASTKVTLLGIARFVEWQLSSLGYKCNSTAEDFEQKLGKDFCSLIGDFYAIHVKPVVLCEEETVEETDSLVPSTYDSSSSEDDFDKKGRRFNQCPDYQVPSLQVSEKAGIKSKRPLSDSAAEICKTGIASTKYRGDTEISFARIFQLGTVSQPLDSEVPPDAPYDGPPVLTMSGFGELGRFGNQVIQYMFLKCCAMVHQTSVQIPPWIGESLFCIRDSRIVRRFPAVVECSHMKANSTFTDTFMNYIKVSNNGRDVREVGPDILLNKGCHSDRLLNVDVWGWFQWHTSIYRPFRSFISNLFRVKPDLKAFLDSEIEKKLCRLDSSATLVGVHIRLGDYKDISASSFGYCAPTKWYLEWLDSIWPKLKNPVLFIASDEIDVVERDFALYNPKTCRSLGLEMPKDYQGLGADFFPDWYILTQCNILAISNSTFSFTTCLLNQRENAKFYRAHYADRIVEISPWNTDPIVHREPCNSMLMNVLNTIQLVYEQQGTKAAFKNVFLHLPLYGIRSLIMRTVLSLKREDWRKGFLDSCLFRKRKLKETFASEEHQAKRSKVLK
ncbi:uncharacterized protein Gasu_18220 [Galdieria sulphuraria]|uniref:Uncharacterized protein n=1 Tax=Galdieria sulphuraria TaxID=130081 RepID=M2Y4D1_GALSU|nr:uncharacterized protein Gasu_18220 [Galdieria sulphuraria]EME30803.1 hypothetical protein Gasu_18220 [Galdieria sulphuraria]|eukprot:XP_005707323.1 hypothetical protein Gasu_18220 [Galdieria sulphuraria]